MTVRREVLSMVLAAVFGPACAADGFSVSVEVDATALREGQVLYELPGRLKVSVREAGRDVALRDYDQWFGNYLNFPRPDGSCPVVEAVLPNEPREIEYKDLSRRLPPVCRVGFPLSLLAEYYIGSVVAVARWWFKNDTPFTGDQMAEFIRQIINGLGNS